MAVRGLSSYTKTRLISGPQTGSGAAEKRDISKRPSASSSAFGKSRDPRGWSENPIACGPCPWLANPGGGTARRGVLCRGRSLGFLVRASGGPGRPHGGYRKKRRFQGLLIDMTGLRGTARSCCRAAESRQKGALYSALHVTGSSNKRAAHLDETATTSRQAMPNAPAVSQTILLRATIPEKWSREPLRTGISMHGPALILPAGAAGRASCFGR